MSEEIAKELTEWQRAEDERVQRRISENADARMGLWRLLVRARDAGLTNTQIADALNQEPDDLDEDMLRLPSLYSTQRVTAMMRDAEAMISESADMLVRKALREQEEEE